MHQFLPVAAFPAARHREQSPVLSLTVAPDRDAPPAPAPPHYSSRQPPRRDSAGAPRRGPGWSEGRAADRARPCGPRPCLAPPRVYAAPRRPWDPGSSECPPQLSSPASGPRESEKGTDFPALPPLRVRPRGRDPGRARGPRLGREGEGEGRGESAACPAGRRDGQDGPSDPNSGRDPGGTLRPCPRRGARADPASHRARCPSRSPGRAGSAVQCYRCRPERGRGCWVGNSFASTADACSGVWRGRGSTNFFTQGVLTEGLQLG